MLTNSLVKPVAALAAAALLAAAAANASDAAPKRPGRAVGKPTATRTAKRINHRVPTAVKVVGSTVMEVTAGATGDGPADQKECNERADWINELLDVVQNPPFQIDGSKGGPQQMELRQMLDRAIDRAEDRGCFVVY
jgi:hypothetical protein